tara:strand:- start:43 stop:234 length:192 start_codon:yes stop_codon:yes gene_type:complete
MNFHKYLNMIENVDWKKEYLEIKGNLLKESQINLLTNGPKSLTQSWALMAMKRDYHKIMGHKI